MLTMKNTGEKEGGGGGADVAWKDQVPVQTTDLNNTGLRIPH